jgi:hypothetical protein
MKHAVFLLSLLPLAVLSQQNNRRVRDSLVLQLQKDSAHIFRKSIARPYLKVENRNSFLANDHVNFLGFLAGATLYERHIICAGFYSLDKKSRRLIALPQDAGKQEFSKLEYVDFAYQYVLINLKYLQLNVPFEVGYGSYVATVSDSLNRNVKNLDGNFVPFGWGLQFIFKPIRWLGLSASGGYREVKQDAIKLSINGWYYSFGIWLDARLIYRELKYSRHKKRIHHELQKYQL